MFDFPIVPDVPAEQRAEGPCPVRYEDVAQDGRLVLDAIPHVLGDVVWQKLLFRHAITTELLANGVVPILSRLVVEGTGGPVGVRRQFDGSGGWQLAHTVGADGAVERILMNAWADLHGPRGRTHGPRIEGAGERLHLGRIFAEHVFTRPFGPREERKVTRLPMDPAVPPDRWTWRPGADLLEPPKGATALDELAADDAPVLFGLCHTDSNQHVNSLVYPRLFEEAAIRRFAQLGKPLVLARFVEIAFRKPCFAGDRARVVLRTFERGDALGAVAYLVPDGAPDATPSCWARLSFAQ